MQAPAAHPDQDTHLPPVPHWASLAHWQLFDALHPPATPTGHEYELAVATHVGAGICTQLSVALPLPAAPVHTPAAHPDQLAQLPLAHWLLLVPPGCAAPEVQLALHVGRTSVPTQLSAPPVPAAPVHTPAAQLAQLAHLPLPHWLLLVHQHAVLPAFGAPIAHVNAPGVHAMTQLSAPPVPAAPVHTPAAQLAQVAHLPLPH